MKITNLSINDGFGSQFYTLMTTLYYADKHNLKFVYTPFEKMEHNYDNDPDFLNKKENLINFIDNFEINYDLRKVSDLNLINIYGKYFQDNIDDFMKSTTLKKIKKLFSKNKSSFDKNYTNIAIHIRRPNSDDSRLDGADTPDNVYLNIIKQFNSIKNKKIHIYSQYSLNTSLYKHEDIILHIDEPIENTFIDFVYADILV